VNEVKREKFGKCYGSTTISERGQVVIPIEARREIGLKPGTRLLVFGQMGPIGKRGLILMPAEMVTDFIHEAMSGLSRLEQMVTEAGEAQTE